MGPVMGGIKLHGLKISRIDGGWSGGGGGGGGDGDGGGVKFYTIQSESFEEFWSV